MDWYIVIVLVMLIPLAFLWLLLISWRNRYNEKFKADVRGNVAKVAVSVVIIVVVACVLLFIRMR